VCAGLYPKGKEYYLTVRTPRGRNGMNEAVAALSVAPVGKVASLPLLEPADVLLSSSYYLDLAKIWEMRATLFNKEQAKALEDFDKNSGRFLLGSKVSTILTQAGPHQRLVVVHQDKPGYKVTPTLRLPAFALVVSMRDPAFAQSISKLFRAGALLGGFQIGLKLVEEKHGEHTVVGYRFPEGGKFPGGDANNIRFNFSPAFVKVGDQFVISSTIELAHKLVDVLAKEAENCCEGEMPLSQTKLYSTGGAALLKALEDQLFTEAMLGLALTPEAARTQVRTLIDLVGRLGSLSIAEELRDNEFRYDIRVSLGK
jgi:hypothetical protein